MYNCSSSKMIRQKILQQIWQKPFAVRIRSNLGHEAHLPVGYVLKQWFHTAGPSSSSHKAPKFQTSLINEHHSSTSEEQIQRSYVSNSAVQSNDWPSVEAHRNVEKAVQFSLKKKSIDLTKNPVLKDFVEALIAGEPEYIKKCLKILMAELRCKRVGQSVQSILRSHEGRSLWMTASEEEVWYVWRIIQICKSSSIKIPIPVYHAFLSYCFKRESDRRMELVESVMADLQENGRILQNFERTFILSTFLQCKTYKDYWEALEEYRGFRDEALNNDSHPPFQKEPNLLYRIINVQLEEDSSTPFLPIEIALEIITDLQEYSDKKHNETIQSILLDHYGKQAKVTNDSVQLLEIRQIILNIHQALIENKGEQMEDNIIVLTALMNAYNMAGLHGNALETWNRIAASDIEINPITVAVVFDTCGFAGRLADARRIFAWIEGGENYLFLMDKNTWDAWLECLARCGALREAIYIALHVMGPALEERAKLKIKPQFRPTVKYKGNQVVAELQKDVTHDTLGTVQAKIQSTKLSEEGLSDSGPDAKTFLLLFSMAMSNHFRKGPHADDTIFPELWRQIQKHHPDVLPHVKNSMISEGSRWRGLVKH